MAVELGQNKFDQQYTRTRGIPIDITSTWETLEDATLYAANQGTVNYCPYEGQIISINGGKSYILVKDDSISTEDKKKHFKLNPITDLDMLDKRYLSKIKDDVTEHSLEVEKGVTTDSIQSKHFDSGDLGHGYRLFMNDSGSSNLEIDELVVRKVATFMELAIKKLSHVGGEILITPASMKCSQVEDFEGYYRCYFNDEKDGVRIYNEFTIGDQARIQTFNLHDNNNEKVSNKYYWGLVVGVGDNYIDLSTEDVDSGSMHPQVGDDIVQLGNRSDESRQKAIILSSIGDDAPSIKQYHGIDGYALSDDNLDLKLSATGNIIRGNLLSQSGKDIEGVIGELQDYIDSIKEQNDRQYVIWFYEYTPTLDNQPAIEWTTDEDKVGHVSDMFYNRAEGKAYRFIATEDGYAWVNITDQQTIKALEVASKAQDTADGKRRTFVSQPTDNDEYDTGDLWVNATYPIDAEPNNMVYNNDALRCIISKEKGAAFDIKHWKPISEYTTYGITASIENKGDEIAMAISDDLTKNIISYINLSEEGVQIGGDKVDIETSQFAVNISSQLEETNNKQNEIKEKHETMFKQTEESIGAVASKITVDEDGLITNIDKSGLVAEDNFTRLFTEAYDASEDTVKKADISTFVSKDAEGYLESGVLIRADNVDIEASKFAVRVNKKLEDTDNRQDKIEKANTLLQDELGSIQEDFSTLDETVQGVVLSQETLIEQTENSIKLISSEVTGVEGKITAINNAGFQTSSDVAEALAQKITTDENGNITNINKSDLVLTNDLAYLNAKKLNYDDKNNITNIDKTGLVLTSDEAYLKAEKLQYNEKGEVTNFNKGGLVTQEGFTQLFAEAFDDSSQNLASKAEISAFVSKDEDGYLESGVKIKADAINLQGAVSFDMFNQNLKDEINNKASQTELDEKADKSAIEDLPTKSEVSVAIDDKVQSKINDLMAENGSVDAAIKAAIVGYTKQDDLNELAKTLEGLISKKLNAEDLKDWAKANTIKDALESQTTIAGGFINTSMLAANIVLGEQATFKGSVEASSYRTLFKRMTSEIVTGGTYTLSIDQGEALIDIGRVDKIVRYELPYAGSVGYEVRIFNSRLVDTRLPIAATIATDNGKGILHHSNGTLKSAEWCEVINGGMAHFICISVLEENNLEVTRWYCTTDNMVRYYNDELWPI